MVSTHPDSLLSYIMLSLVFEMCRVHIAEQLNAQSKAVCVCYH